MSSSRRLPACQMWCQPLSHGEMEGRTPYIHMSSGAYSSLLIVAKLSPHLLVPALSASRRALMASSREEVPAALTPRTDEGAEAALGMSGPRCLAD